jgi:hypothetical protein
MGGSMRTNPGLLAASAAGAAVLAISAGTALAAGGGGTCAYKLTNGTPGPSSTMSGSVKCSRPAGKGKAKFSYSSTLAPKGMSLQLIYSGKFNDKFKHGSVKGTFKTKGTLVPPSGPTITMTGKFKITGGTHKLRKAHGKGTMTCTSSDFTAHFTCTQVLTKGRL